MVILTVVVVVVVVVVSVYFQLESIMVIENILLQFNKIIIYSICYTLYIIVNVKKLFLL